MPSKDPNAAPTQVGTTVNPAAISWQYSVNASNVVTGYQQYALLYFGLGPDGYTHLYGLPLFGSAGAPTPIQLGSLALRNPACGWFAAQTDILDPTTLFVVLGDCDSGQPVFEVVHWTDSASTAPTVVNVAGFNMLALYQPSGVLGGLVLQDTSGNLLFYNGDGFTNPTILTSGVSYWNFLYDSSVITTGNLAGGSVDYIAIYTESGNESLWRVTYAGQATNVYSSSGDELGNVVGDSTNIYFSDIDGATMKESIYQQAISSANSAEIALYSAPAYLPPYEPDRLPAPGLAGPLSLLGSNGTLLVLIDNAATLPEHNPPPSIQTLAVGVPGSPVTIAGPSDNYQQVFMSGAKFGDFSSQVIFANAVGFGGPGVTSEALWPNGTVIQAPLADSTFVAVGQYYANPSSSFGPVLREVGNTGGGATVALFDARTGTETPFVGPGGDAFQIPILSLCGISNTLISGTILLETGEIGAVAFDLSLGLATPLAVPSSQDQCYAAASGPDNGVVALE